MKLQLAMHDMSEHCAVWESNEGNDRLQKKCERELAKVCEDSNFFRTKARPIPQFSSEELWLGDKLGEGAFGEVYVVQGFNQKSPRFREYHKIYSKESQTSTETSLTDDDSESSHYVEWNQKRTELRQQLFAEQAQRGEFSRFAVKQVHHCVRADTRYNYILRAVFDLSMEAKILSNLSHPNVVKIHATVGKPGRMDFGFVMDRLAETLEDKIDRQAHCRIKKNPRLLARLFAKRNQSVTIKNDPMSHIGRLKILLDVALAMRYLHENKILFRDLKPANVGFNAEGTTKLFDFGIARELREVDLVDIPDGYNATGRTGTYRYMAPEVSLCQNYGFSADVYSFGISLWEVMSLHVPFALFNYDKIKSMVYTGNYQLPRLQALNNALNDLMSTCWSKESKSRPSFETICTVLEEEIARHSEA